ncbi:CRISPR-associated helicase Cas3' [Nocardia sp. CA-084685]|uniref:CRISPR-associated helicase Cas3' n=1 Tax=Nocardia sp. CA-084685 TaxID=3239970 RepID=UPI003D959D0D
MSELQRLRAKSPHTGFPDGEALTDHLSATLVGAQRLHDRVGSLAVVPEGFWTWVKAAALLHDAGKVPDGFQLMVAASRGPVWGQRHEVYSLGFVADLLALWPNQDQLWVGLGVLTHHRPLTGPAARAIFSTHLDPDPVTFAARFGDVDPTAQTQLRSWLARVLHSTHLVTDLPDPGTDIAKAGYQLLEAIRDKWDEDDIDPGHCLIAVLLQGAVTFADHVSSAHGRLLTDQPINRVFALGLVTGMETAGKPIREHQFGASAVTGHLLLRTPTGSGKTEAALLWAAAQVEQIHAEVGGQPRVFYLLPYLASINAMVDRLAHLTGDSAAVGVVHSKAASYHLNRSLCASEDLTDSARQAVSRAAATRLFRELVRVGTPYQLLRGALAGPACASILIDAANSVFILDELHAYEPQRLGMVLAMINFWTRIGGRVAIVSATLPQPLITLLNEATEPTELTPIDADNQSWPLRHRLSLREAHLTCEQSLSEIDARLRDGQSVLVVANNVADAREIYTELAPIAQDLYGDDAALLLHSRFKTMDRAEIEARIRPRYGTGRPHQPGLLVATQVVEVSLDVSFDALHTSGAPLEALIQRFGRINRTGTRRPSDVVVHTPRYSTRRAGADEFADGVYEREPTELTMSILTANNSAALDEHTLGTWLDQLYQTKWGQQWTDQVRHHRDRFAEDFLSFTLPFDDSRAQLADKFDELFDGAEAILAEDRDDYATALDSVDDPRAGRLLGSQYLIPLPHYGRYLGAYDQQLKVVVINADYSQTHGLEQIHRDTRGADYRLGEVI